MISKNDSLSEWLRSCLTHGSPMSSAVFGSHTGPSNPVPSKIKFVSNVLLRRKRVRASRLDERLRNLDKYCESVTSKKQQRSESVSNDRAGALKGSQIYSINQRVEDRPKNILLNKRVRTSVAESRDLYRV